MAKTKTELNKMTKSQLEDYGRSVGIELDRRLKKATIVQQLLEYEAEPTTIESVVTRRDLVSATDDQVQEFIETLPKFNGKNGGVISSIVMKNLHLFSGHSVSFGPDGAKYHITVKGSKINQTFKL
jgi:hypothetical protein|tara:strand:- start:678 stop:1055 length:378 start_codon:yes stop_codon:yes gene_type:complete